jgi:hypothetical protein
MDDRDDEAESGSAEAAFDALRAQVVVMRQAMEALPRAMKDARPVDTTETLGEIVQALRAVSAKLAEIERHPALRMTPQQYANAIAGVGDGLMRGAVQQLDRATAETVRERNALAAMIGTMNGQRRQIEWLLGIGLGAFLLGILISPVFVRLLPFGWDGEVAAFIMRGDRWQAGGSLMAAGNPEAWRVGA